MSHSLSYLMGAPNIHDDDLARLGIEIKSQTESGSRTLVIPETHIDQYKDLIKRKLDNGFWNEIVGEKEIVFIFKFPDGHVEEHVLSEETEKDIDALCARFNNEPPESTANVYKYIADNEFYHDFMVAHYSGMINR